ncbi:CHAT domain-containing protein [Streptomyces sp. cmx-4-9]|uniref:CHAT domain-containing protein n=1 Tax=Streptomyces sp. cmx-4-9 TaxID=2790941 RepID=UPI003981400D
MGDDARRSQRLFGRSVRGSLDELHRRGLQETGLYLRTGDLSALQRARELHQRVVEAGSDRTRGRDVHLGGFADAEDLWYRHTRDPAALLRAVDLHRRALAATAGGPSAGNRLHGLGSALHLLHRHTGDAAPLVEAVELLRLSLQPPPAVPAERAGRLAGLAEVLDELHDLTGDPEHLREAVAVLRAALDHTPPGTREATTRRTNLAAYLDSWYRLTGDRPARDEAVDLLRRMREEVLRDGGIPPWQPTVSLAGWLAERFRQDGGLAELDEAVALLRRVLEVEAEADDASFDETYRLVMTVRVAQLALQRAARSGQLRWADWAVQTLTQAVRALPYEDLNHGVLLFELGKAHAGRHHLTGDPADLEAAVDRLRGALDALGRSAHNADNHRAAASELATHLLHRHARTGSPADLDEAVRLLREAVREAGPDDPNFAALHGALGQSLLERFTGRHDLADLDRCVDHLLRALAVLPPGDPNRAPVLSTLSSAHLARYHHTAHRPHLDEAVAAQREALEGAKPGDLEGPALLGNLALLLRVRLDADGATGPSDADEAVGLLRQALALWPGRSDQHRTTAHQLAEALRTRAEILGDIADLQECVELLRTVVDGYPAGHPGQISSRSALAEALHKLSLATQDGRLLDEAWEVARGAVALDAAPVHARLRARATLGQVCGTRQDWEGAGHWLTEAVRLLPRLAARDLARTDQQYVLAREHGLAAEAAAYAIQAGRPEQALKVLEHGRGVLLGRLLQSRETDLARLRERAPELAERFVRLRDAQDPQPTGTALSAGPAGQAGQAVQESERIRVREVEWDLLVAQIRALPGLGDFLRPPEASEIVRRAGEGGPVVVVNISVRCDALIVADGRIEVVPLRTTAEEVHHRVTGFLTAVDTPSPGTAGTGVAERLARQDTVSELLEWLWDTVAGPVLDRLAPAPAAPGAAPRRIWWCPQGPLAFLPLHAAGYHGPRAAPGRPRCALERVVSSYTPTVAALHHARARQAPADRTGVRPLIVAMSRTPGQGALPNAEAEARAVRRYLADSGAPLTLADGAATRDSVLDALRHSGSAHFACHAVADPQDPSACRILTHDHATRPLTVTDVAGLRLDGAHLAFLSACATSSTRHDLVDESIHITGAFQLAGFRHVVGTLWPVADELGPEMAESFYAALARPDTGGDEVALALHAAVAALHDRYAWFPSLWAAHVHVGV